MGRRAARKRARRWLLQHPSEIRRAVVAIERAGPGADALTKLALLLDIIFPTKRAG